MKPWHIILILILCFLCFLTGRHTKKAEVGFICKTDTFIRVDTIRDSIPYPVYETVIQTVPELFPVYITLGGDTIREPVYIPVPITQKEYRTEDYRLSISGYKPNLDYIEIYRKTEQITKVVDRRFGIGITAGYGIGRNGLSPYVGIGGFYRIW
ncbi:MULTISPECIES: DUF6808 domain-containing protein [Parabacteroides]|jgi:hypothetical protein|uniref:Uncharacterized protein n=3 Tax=Parabacteroides TaxID=375288 RepID=A0ACC6D4D1_9BACT|nr:MULTISPECIES: hypothetical protein [Parabacteroides]KAA5263293.1 hypothetical protein F2Z14_25880 [Bacteroides faecis]MBS6224856.1 hypothetical protein [Parabacteroides johnsonii]MDC7148034.1 hypothetical protein [Parabacteroides johnsonii]MDC7158272.1 hypothetical protein [Parabacteroides johnsonii]MTU34604.1 hypothetical protein [Parabacteroides merdae]